jgi:DNA-binding transcriptional ArsR family regulator
MASAELLLHPVRLRIVQAFLGDRAMTTGDLHAELSDLPAASLYRHVARLVDGGVLTVVAERRVRGTVERTYVLRNAAARIDADQVAKMSPEEHLQAFLVFVAGLIGDAERYLAGPHVDPIRDGASYSLAGLWLDDAEFAEFARDLYTIVQPRGANAPRAGRTRRVLATVVLPADTPTSSLSKERPQ